MPGLIMDAILMWVLTSLMLGATMMLVLRRREHPVRPVDLGDPPLMYRARVARLSRRVSGESCQARSRLGATTHARR